MSALAHVRHALTTAAVAARAHARRGSIVLFMIVGGLLLFGSISQHASAVSLPSPVYDIETTSGGTHYVRHAAVGVPWSIDVNGDAVTDVTVTVSLVDLGSGSGLLGANLTITQNPVSLLLRRATPPLKIVAGISLVDPTTLEVTQQVRVGYDTGQGGSVPAHFEASLSGLQSGFNPLHAQVDTIGGVLGLTTNPTRPPTYTGPLTLLAGVGLPNAAHTDIAARYQPFPGTVGIDYGSDADGAHVHYSQPPAAQTRLNAVVTGTGPAASGWTATTDIDRMPSELGADFELGANEGHFLLTQQSAAATDIRLAFVSHAANGGQLSVSGAVNGLPDRLETSWTLCPPAAQDCTPSAVFDTSGAGVGAVDLRLRNFSGAPTLFTVPVPDELQFLSLDSATSGSRTETAIAAHLEHIQHADIGPTENGFSAHVHVGDGVSPLGLYFLSDDRAAAGEDAGRLLAADAHLDPLPQTIGLQVKAASITAPLEVVVDSSTPTDLTAHGQLSPAGASATCGGAGTLCADLRMEHIPTHVDTHIGDFDDDSPAGVDVDTARPAPEAAAMNLSATLVAGAGALDVPATEGTPLYGQIDIRDVPEHLRVRYHTGPDGDLDRAEFHACEWDFSAQQPACRQAPGSVGEIDFSLRNFAASDRPADLPPPFTSTEQFASLLAREASAHTPLLFEAAGRVRALSEVNVRLAGGILGVRATTAGGNFIAHADIDTPQLTLAANAALTPLPSTVDFCLRPGGTPSGTKTGAVFTTSCEIDNPYHEDPAPAPPTTFAVSASSTFGLDADVRYVTKAEDPGDNHVDIATLHLPVAPAGLSVNVRPAVTCAADATGCVAVPTRADYAVPADTPPLSMTVSGQDSVGDAICDDLRPGASAACVSGTLQNIPRTASLCFDPTAAHRCDRVGNLVLATGESGGDAGFNLRDLRLSSITPDSNSGRSNALLATATLLDIPDRVIATVADKAFTVHADGSGLAQVTARVQNYLAPDSIDAQVPAQRGGLPDAQSSIAMFTRGQKFTAIADLHDVTDAGFVPSLAADGTPLPTQRATVGFGADSTVRAYADLVSDDGSRLIGDVTIEHNPAKLSLCFRGADPGTTTAIDPTWCDSAAPDLRRLGALALVQETIGEPADVHAFVRQAGPGNTGVLTGVMDALGLPPVLHASFGDGTYDAAGLTTAGAPAGIGKLTFDVADFDLPASETGYQTAPLPPFTPGSQASAPLPAPEFDGSYLSVVATDSAFQARGELGSNGAHLQHVHYADQACAKPSNADRLDYPYYPRTAGTSYTCVRVDFDKDDGATAPLRLFADLRRGGSRMVLRDAGLTDVPTWLQATIAQTPTLNADSSLRRRCGWQGGDATVEANGGDGDCMPALLRFDSSEQATAPVLYGSVSFASSDARADAELANLGATRAQPAMRDGGGQAIDLGADPASEWDTDTGVRLRVGTFATSATASDTAVLVGLRESLPGSLTVDQLQAYSDSGVVPADDGSGSDCGRLVCPPDLGAARADGGIRPDARCLPEDCGTPPGGDPAPTIPPTYDLMDVRAHFVALTYQHSYYGGIPVASLGNLEALLTTFDADGPISSVQVQNVRTNPGGSPIPGELGIDLSQRGSLSGAAGSAHNKITYRIGLTVSGYLNLKAHIGMGAGAIGSVDAVIKDVGQSENSGEDGYCNADPSRSSCRPKVVNLELVTGPQQLHAEPPGEPSSSQVVPDIHIKDIAVELSMYSASTANVVVNHNAAQNGVQVTGFGYYADGTSYPAAVPVSGRLDFDKFNIELSPVDTDLTSVDLYMHLAARLSVGFSSESSDFVLSQNVLHVQGKVRDGTATIGPIDLTVPTSADLTADVAIPVAPDVAVRYQPVSEPDLVPLAETWNQCAYYGFYDSGNTIDVQPRYPVDRTVEPVRDGRISVLDSLGFFDISLKDKAMEELTNSMCGLSTEVDLGDAGYPSDPVDYPSHPVAGLTADRFGTVHPDQPVLPTAPGSGSSDPTPPVTAMDSTAPQSALGTVPAGPTGPSGYYQQSPLAVLVADDEPGGSGVAAISYRLDSGPTTQFAGPVRIGPGVHTLTWYATDHAGNVETQHSRQFWVDTAAPGLSVTVAAPDGDAGWYRSSPTVTVTASDSGSGVAHVYTSLDGAAFTASGATQAVHVPEGVHTVISYATDTAGHHSATAVRTIGVDSTAPTSAVRIDPAAAAVSGWWRVLPEVHLRAGDAGSGVQAIQYSVDGSPFTAYLDPFDLGEGRHVVRVRAIDVAGNVGPVASDAVAVDSMPPTATATSATPALWIALLGKAKLYWSVTDNLAHSLHVQVVVLTATGDVAAILDGGTVAVTPGVLTSGYTQWNGRDGSLTGALPLGVYTYEVVVTDEAGNAAQSANSLPMQLKLL